MAQLLATIQRRVAKIIGEDDLRRVLTTSTPLRVKLGVDPTDPHLHIGHLVPLLVLKAFQDLGHTAVLLIGDYTACIGDPSGRETARPPLTAEEAIENAETYREQVLRILDAQTIEVRRQSEWYDTFSLHDVMKLLASTSMSQIMEHSTFRDRIEKGKPFMMHEAFYPLLQAYDSVALEADVEIGALDQLFNIALGRTVQKYYGQPPQAAVLTPYIEGTDGRKMSKTFGNTINLDDAPADVYGKIMSIPDDLIVSYAALLTNVPVDEAEQAVETGGETARDAKRRVARSLIALLYSQKEAKAAEQIFTEMVSGERPPEEIVEEATLPQHEWTAVDLVATLDPSLSRGEAKRLVEQGAIEILDNDQIRDWTTSVVLNDGDVVRIGRRRYFRIRVE